jgi:hypothetical protein
MVVVLVSGLGLSAAATEFAIVTKMTMMATMTMENVATAVRREQEEVGCACGEKGEQDKKLSGSHHGSNKDGKDGLGKTNKADPPRAMMKRFLAVLGWVRGGVHNMGDSMPRPTVFSIFSEVPSGRGGQAMIWCQHDPNTSGWRDVTGVEG